MNKIILFLKLRKKNQKELSANPKIPLNVFSCFYLFLVVSLLFTSSCFPCTVILVTKGASATGSVIIAHTDDSNYEDDKRIVYVPAANYLKEARRNIAYTYCGYPRYNGEDRGPNYTISTDHPNTPVYGTIEQVEHTYAYFDANYAIVNEEGVAIAETTCASKFRYENSGRRLFEITELTRIALERAKTAQEAIQIIGSLAEKYGYFEWGELLIIADKNEGWVFEISASPKGYGALWIAKKVPDGEVFVAANEFRIRDIKKTDPDLLYSENLFEVAREQNWLSAINTFDWLESVSPGEYYHPYYSLRRVWRAQSLINPSLYLLPWVENGYTKEYPFSIKPQKKLTIQNVASIFRDYYQDTEFDLSKCLSAGPFGCPYRYIGPYDPRMNLPGAPRLPIVGAWERPISTTTCGYSHIVELRSDLPKPLASIAWIGLDQPLTCCYMPFYVGINNLPKSFSDFSAFRFNSKTAWWAFNFVSNLAASKFSYMIKDIKLKQKRLEGAEFRKIAEIEKKALALWKKDPAQLSDFLTDYCLTNAETIINQWWDLAFYLFEKYANGSVNLPQPLKEVGYPEEWLNGVHYYQRGPISYKNNTNQ